MKRRAFVLGALAASLASACKKELRCKNCGMKIDPASPWRTDLVAADGTTTHFDSPRCAFTSWRSGKTSATTLKVQDYYDRQWKEGSQLEFVIGGDVVGPMGPDLVPVDRARATKFIQDHGADKALSVDEVTMAALDSIK